MNKLIIVRAGSTVWQSGLATADESRIQGTVPLPLSEEAKQNLRGIAEVLQREKPDRLYSSGNESSGPTAEFLAQLCNIKTRTLPCLHEQDYGLWQGLRIAEIKQRYGRAYKQWRSDPASVRPPQGETLDETLARAQEALRKIRGKNRDKTVVVVAAHTVAALLECILTDTPLEQIWDIIEKGEDLHIFDLQREASLIIPQAQE